ncbi:DUF6443 domain-containing protein [Chryseobacterium lathyri]|uniref:DUF6443 domain-containing protein n=1 Tax=Chryseobacterium lathyri TaxID=395933 RepID=UPI00278717E4|nr:DUF6443 domain-containing protein [Chryseobacterium lathyri]MDQ0067702.1 RHS repeat-associated protein [Chryseobacterium lathyri]
MKKILFILLGIIFSYSYSQNLTDTENYIYKKTYLSDPFDPVQKQLEDVQYLDGLGRPKQIISVKSTPSGQDMVLPIVYDQFGRVTKDYLPVPVQTSNAGIQTSVTESTVNSYYGVTNAFSEKELESSPLSRMFQSASPGEEWKMNSGHTVKYAYDANSTSDQVKKYQATTTWDNTNQIYNSTLSQITIYDENSLYKFSVKDEDNNEKIVFKDLYGHIVLIRKNDGTHNIDTYYVYDSNDHLAYVIPPLASVSSALTSTTLDNLCYQYRYDNKNRLVEKKLPGKGWEYMVYNKADKLIMSQDANMRISSNWMFTKYDKFGRVTYTGISITSLTRQALQTNANASTNVYESRSTAAFTMNGMPIYYSNVATPVNVGRVLIINYYDTYPPLPAGVSIPSYIINPTQSVLTQDAQSSSRSTKSFPTASYIKNIEDDNWSKDFFWYDTKGRVIGTHSVNHLGGYTKTEAELDFSGLPKQTKTYHRRLNTDTEKIVTETFEYDNQNRLKVQKHKIDNNTEEILAQNEYNELSQLKTKKVGGTNISMPLQTVDYIYNIRGWMTAVNDPNNLGNDLFGYKIKYAQREGLEIPNSDFPELKVKPKYNGNIAEVDWKTLTEENEPLKRYGYSYDPLNRLLGGFYQKAGSETAKEYFEKLEYDLNGNIQRLKRSEGALIGGSTAQVIDNLKYDYVGNRLIKVTDEQQNPSGYPYLVNPNTIQYDNGGIGNGNMTSHLDKGISSIQYNYLNLPKQVTQNAKITNYTYRADGVKVKKLFGDLETDYLDGFQYKSTFQIESWNGEGTYHPDPNEIPVLKLRIIPTSEGYYDTLLNKYVYNFTDHLGNLRLSYTDTNGDGIIQPRQYNTSTCLPTFGCLGEWKPGEIVETNNYYPFGMLHNYAATTRNAYQYKYQGQELQENGWYSFKWRNYMPDVGRFFNIDPLSEMYAYQSHYNFSENRVIDAREIEGLEAYVLNAQGDMEVNGLSLSHTEYSIGADGTRNIETVDLGTFQSSSSASAVSSQNLGGISWGDAARVGVGFVPIVGSGLDIYEGIRDGNWVQAGIGVGGLALDIATLGAGSVIKGGVKAIGTELVEEGIEMAVKDAAKTAAKEMAEKEAKGFLVPMAEETLEQASRDLPETIGTYSIYGTQGLVGDTYTRNIFLMETKKKSLSGLRSTIATMEKQAAQKGANKISIYGAAVINDGFLNPAIAKRFGYSFEKIGSGSLLQKTLK